MTYSWIYLTIGVIISLVALGVVAVNTALEHSKKMVLQNECDNYDWLERKGMLTPWTVEWGVKTSDIIILGTVQSVKTKLVDKSYTSPSADESGKIYYVETKQMLPYQYVTVKVEKYYYDETAKFADFITFRDVGQGVGMIGDKEMCITHEAMVEYNIGESALFYIYEFEGEWESSGYSRKFYFVNDTDMVQSQRFEEQYRPAMKFKDHESEINAYVSHLEYMATVVTERDYEITEGMTISFQQLHKYTQKLEAFPYDGGKQQVGLLYVKVGSAFLEVVNSTRVVKGQFVFTIINQGCIFDSEEYQDHCELIIIREKIDTSTVEIDEFSRRIDFAAQKAKLFKIYQNDKGQLFAIRFLGSEVGEIDSSLPYVAKSFSASFDVITNYGVRNIELNDVTVGHVESSIIGPNKIDIKINEVRHANTGFEYIFDITVNVKTIDDPNKYPVTILAYN